MNFKPTLYDQIGGRPGLQNLLHHFYSVVRQHALLGPIFNQQIEDWPSHLEKIGSFWARLTGGPSAYSGQMPMKHLNLGIEPRHFSAWLQLWRFNCQAHLQEPVATNMISLAEELERRLKSVVCPQPL